MKKSIYFVMTDNLFSCVWREFYKVNEEEKERGSNYLPCEVYQEDLVCGRIPWSTLIVFWMKMWTESGSGRVWGGTVGCILQLPWSSIMYEINHYFFVYE